MPSESAAREARREQTHLALVARHAAERPTSSTDVSRQALDPGQEGRVALAQALALVAQVKQLVLELADLLPVRHIVDDDVVVLLRDAEQLVLGPLELCREAGRWPGRQ